MTQARTRTQSIKGQVPSGLDRNGTGRELVAESRSPHVLVCSSPDGCEGGIRCERPHVRPFACATRVPHGYPPKYRIPSLRMPGTKGMFISGELDRASVILGAASFSLRSEEQYLAVGQNPEPQTLVG